MTSKSFNQIISQRIQSIVYHQSTERASSNHIIVHQLFVVPRYLQILDLRVIHHTIAMIKSLCHIFQIIKGHLYIFFS